jgi:hypothetical protein
MTHNSRLSLAVQLVLSGLFLTGCAGLPQDAVTNLQPPRSMSGKITAVSLVMLNETNGNILTTTAVTLVNAGLSSTVSFCGNQVSQFSISAVVQVTFTPADPCSVLGKVVVLN